MLALSTGQSIFAIHSSTRTTGNVSASLIITVHLLAVKLVHKVSHLGPQLQLKEKLKVGPAKASSTALTAAHDTLEKIRIFGHLLGNVSLICRVALEGLVLGPHRKEVSKLKGSSTADRCGRTLKMDALADVVLALARIQRWIKFQLDGCSGAALHRSHRLDAQKLSNNS